MKKLTLFIIPLCLILILSSCKIDFKEIAQTTEKHTHENETEATEITTQEEITLFSETEDFAGIKTLTNIISISYAATAVQAAVIKDGKLYSTYEYGLAEKAQGIEVISDTKFRVASLSKLITDMVFMRLTEEGLVDLNADISDYLGFRVRSPYYPDTVITPAMLMSHTSSIIDTSAFLNSRLTGSSVSIQSLLASSAFSGACPGTTYSYSNFSVALIGSICEKATGMCFDDIAKKYIFAPTGIDAAYIASNLDEPSLVAALYGSGGYSLETQFREKFHSELGQTHHLVQGNLTISAKDYITLAAAIANKGLTAHGIRILSESSVEAMLGDSIGFGFVKNSRVIDGKNLTDSHRQQFRNVCSLCY